MKSVKQMKDDNELMKKTSNIHTYGTNKKEKRKKTK